MNGRSRCDEGLQIHPVGGSSPPASIHVEYSTHTVRRASDGTCLLDNACCRIHQTLKTTPAVAAGVADHVWKLSEIIALLENAEQAVPMKRGPYKKRSLT